MDVVDPTLPDVALSVRQPWAWAIIHGGKEIENRSLEAIRAGGMTERRICIHAASGMTQNEYKWGAWRLQKHGVQCPHPADLLRGAIIGTVDVVEIITESDSAWFGGKAGLRLANPSPIDPIPAKGALGYFHWRRSSHLSPVPQWMQQFGRPSEDTANLFSDLPLHFAEAPKKPF